MSQTFRRALLALVIAVPAIAGAQQQQGTARSPDALSRARSLVEQRRYKAALALVDSLARVAPGSRDAELGRAQVLAWTGRLADAIRAYERWVQAHPRDVEAAERLAAVLTWAGRLDVAERLYQLLAFTGSVEAERGLARIMARRGNLAGAERQWRSIVAKRPTDVEAWLGLAQVLRWQNRPRDARVALARAVELNPANREAREQLRWVEASLAPRVEPTLASTSDNDDNRVTTIGLAVGIAPQWDGELSLGGKRRSATVGGLHATSLAAALAATAHIRQLTLRGTVGGSRLDDESTAPAGATRDVFTFSATASAQVGRRVHIGAGIGREPFDETAPLIQRGVVGTTYGGGASVDVGRRATLTGRVEHVDLGGATRNTRTGGAASLTWKAPFVLLLGTSVSGYGYASDPADGYFAPRRYLLGEGTALIAVGGQLGWSVTLDGGVGAQAIEMHTGDSETQPAARAGGSIAYRPKPGLEWSIWGRTTNAASSATSSLTSYRSSTLGLRSRFSF